MMSIGHCMSTSRIMTCVSYLHLNTPVEKLSCPATHLIFLKSITLNRLLLMPSPVESVFARVVCSLVPDADLPI